jgi:hypothetical protein
MKWASLLVGLSLVLGPVPAPAASGCPGNEIGSAACCCGPEAGCCCWESDPQSAPPPTPAKVASSPGDALIAEEPVATREAPRPTASTTVAPDAQHRVEGPPPFLLGCSLLC